MNENMKNNMICVLEHANILDVCSGDFIEDVTLVISDGLIQEISKKTNLSADVSIDLKGLTLMPGLCDAHVHVTASTGSFPQLQKWPQSYATARATQVLHGMLMRGFTTVRDCGGADFGLAKALDEGFISGPKVLFCGNAISQTCGHSDMRDPNDNLSIDPYGPGLGRIADGVSQMRYACRDELRKGAHFIKIMGSGGVSSPSDMIENTQFSIDELTAAVEEAKANRTYVAGHLYTAEAINRALDCGVTSIEHGNLANEQTLDKIIAKSAYLVPTIVIHDTIVEEGIEAGFTPEMLEKVHVLVESGRETHSKAYKKGVKMVYGTDLLGIMHRHQLKEFQVRAEFQKPIDIIRSATVTAAELFRLGDNLGQIKEGFKADLIAFEGDPTRNIEIMVGLDKNLQLIIQNGVIIKNSY